jgi:hypothetical protein
MTSCHVPQQFKPLVCVAPVVIVSGAGDPLINNHVPQQFKPLRCVAPVVTVSVPGVP